MFINERHALQKQLEAQGKIVSELMQNTEVKDEETLEATKNAFAELGKKFDQYYKNHWFLGKLVLVFDKIFIAPKSRISSRLDQIETIRKSWQAQAAEKAKLENMNAELNDLKQKRDVVAEEGRLQGEEFKLAKKANEERIQELQAQLAESREQANVEAQNRLKESLTAKMEEMQGEVSQIRGGLLLMQSAVGTIGEMLGRKEIQTDEVFKDWRKKAQAFSADWGEFAKTNNVEEMINFGFNSTEATKEEFDRLFQLIKKFDPIRESVRPMIYESAKLARGENLDPELKKKLESLGSEAAKNLTRESLIVWNF